MDGYRANFWENAQALLSREDIPLRPERAVQCFNEALKAHGKPVQIYSDRNDPPLFFEGFNS